MHTSNWRSRHGLYRNYQSTCHVSNWHYVSIIFLIKLIAISIKEQRIIKNTKHSLLSDFKGNLINSLLWIVFHILKTANILDLGSVKNTRQNAISTWTFPSIFFYFFYWLRSYCTIRTFSGFSLIVQIHMWNFMCVFNIARCTPTIYWMERWTTVLLFIAFFFECDEHFFKHDRNVCSSNVSWHNVHQFSTCVQNQLLKSH